MGFLNSTTSFTRLAILEDVPKDLLPQIQELLKKHAFKDIDNMALERSFGWTSFDDMLDTNWEHSYCDKADYICFSLRLDTRRVPPAVLKKHTRLALMEEEKLLSAQGKKFVSKERRAEIKEKVKLEMMTRFLPIPAEFQVVWSLQRNMIYLASAQQKIVNMFIEKFVESFDLHLEPLSAYPLALQILGEDASKELDEITPSNFV